MKKIAIVTIALLLSFSTLTANAASNWSGHWAESYLNNAVSKGWVSNTNDANGTIKLEEFIVMLQKAMGITPDSSFEQSTIKNHVPIPFDDTEGTEIQSSGYLQTAMDFGILLSDDFPDKKLSPLRNAKRSDAILMTTRAIGRVYSATTSDYESLPFTDNQNVPSWLKGFVGETAKFDVLIGYPDKSVKTDHDITLAETAAIIGRAVEYVEQGIDQNIKVTVASYLTETGEMLKSEQVSLDVPAQIIDGILYVPAKSIYAAGIKLHTNSYPTNDYWVMWRNGRQVLLLEYGVTATYQSANKNAIITTGVVNDADIQDSDTNKLPYTARTLRGELMIPVYNVQNDTGIQILFAKGKNYDANEKSLYISINEPSRPSS